MSPVGGPNTHACSHQISWLSLVLTSLITRPTLASILSRPNLGSAAESDDITSRLDLSGCTSSMPSLYANLLDPKAAGQSTISSAPVKYEFTKKVDETSVQEEKKADGTVLASRDYSVI